MRIVLRPVLTLCIVTCLTGLLPTKASFVNSALLAADAGAAGGVAAGRPLLGSAEFKPTPIARSAGGATGRGGFRGLAADRVGAPGQGDHQPDQVSGRQARR